MNKDASSLLDFLALIAIPAAVWACSCSGTNPEGALAVSDLAFTAYVLKHEDPPAHRSYYNGDSIFTIGSGDMIRWLVVPTRGWKGSLTDTLALYSPRNGASCGYVFQTGKEYLVYARILKQKSDYWWSQAGWPDSVAFPLALTTICNRTRPITHAQEDLAYLGEPTWER